MDCTALQSAEREDEYKRQCGAVNATDVPWIFVLAYYPISSYSFSFLGIKKCSTLQNVKESDGEATWQQIIRDPGEEDPACGPNTVRWPRVTGLGKDGMLVGQLIPFHKPYLLLLSAQSVWH